MGNEVEVALVGRARRQLGLLRTADLLELCCSRKRRDSHLETGAWVRVQRGVFKVSPGQPTLEQRDLAALFACGDGAVLSHLTAARKLGLEGPPAPRIQVTIPDSRRVTALAGIEVFTSRDLRLADTATRGPLRFTRVGRTLLDLASVLDSRWLRVAFDSALRLSCSNFKWMSLVLEEQGHGKDGAKRLRELLAEYSEEGEFADSLFESLAMELGLATGRKPRRHFVVSDGLGFNAEVDFAWPELRLAIECDSWKHHGSNAAFRRDRFRDRKLLDLLWETRRYTWHEVRFERQRVIDELCAARVRRAATLASVSPRTAAP